MTSEEFYSTPAQGVPMGSSLVRGPDVAFYPSLTVVDDDVESVDE